MDVGSLLREDLRQFIGKPLNIWPEPNAPTLVGDAIQQFVLHDIDVFLKSIEHEAMGIEPVFTETVKHGGPLVKGDVVAPECSARATRVVALVHHSHREASLGQKSRGCQSRDAPADDDYVILNLFCA